MAATKAVQKKHWYKIHTTECVLCWKGETWRERQYGEKPKDPKEIYVFEQYACDYHFM